MQRSIHFSKTASENSVHNLNEFKKLPKINPNDFTTIVNGCKVEDFLENPGDSGYAIFYENGEVTMANNVFFAHHYWALNENKRKGSEPDTNYPFFAGKVIPLTDDRLIITDRTGGYREMNNVDITNLKSHFETLLHKEVQMMPNPKETNVKQLISVNNLISHSQESQNSRLVSNASRSKVKDYHKDTSRESYLSSNKKHKTNSKVNGKVNDKGYGSIVMETETGRNNNNCYCSDGKSSFCGIF